jgi:putative tricarboxylic transport membrane protein
MLRSGNNAGWAGRMGRTILKDGDVISGAALAALGVYIMMQARVWDYYTPDGPGPGFFPLWYGVTMVGLSLSLIVSSVWKARSANGRPGAAGAIDWQAAGRALATWAAFAVSVALMGVLGFVLSFVLLTFFIVIVVFRRPMLTAAVTAVVAALVFHLIFPVILNVPLPTGFLGF